MNTKTKRLLFSLLQKFFAIAFIAAAAAVEFSETADSTGGGVLLVVIPFCLAMFFTKENLFYSEDENSETTGVEDLKGEFDR